MAEDPSLSLAAFIAQLKQAATVPRPPTDDWTMHVNRVSVPGRIAQVSEEEWDYWLEVLPPRWMRGGAFCFAEGAEAFRFFWYDRPTSRHFCRQLTWEETVTFCRLAGIPIPS